LAPPIGKQEGKVLASEDRISREEGKLLNAKAVEAGAVMATVSKFAERDILSKSRLYHRNGRYEKVFTSI